MATLLAKVAPPSPPQLPTTEPESAAPELSSVDVEQAMNAAMGCKSSEVALALLAQLVQLDDPNGQVTSEPGVNALLTKNTAAIVELEPKNATQAILATQMVASHRMAMLFLQRSILPGQIPPAVDANVNRATRLLRLWVEQAEMMSKLKGTAGQQKVTVEHVTVQPGGQAVVGMLNQGGAGG